MLRTIFVLLITAIGGGFALTGAFRGLLFYLWIAYFRPESWVWDGFIAQLNLSLIAGVLVLIGALFARERFRFSLRTALLGLILAQGLLATMLSDTFAFCWPYFIDFAKTLVITYLMTTLVTDTARFRQVLMVIALSLGFEGAKQGWIQMILNPGAPNLNELMMLGDNNAVAVGMLMLVGIFVALASTAAGRWERRFMAAMIIGVTYRAISTYSRGGFLACVALAVWFMFRSRTRLPALLTMVLVAAVITPALPDAFWDRMRTIGGATTTEGVENADGAVKGRLHFWQVAATMVSARPVTGIGLNGFTATYNRFDFSNGEFGSNRSVHNSWAGLAAELGLPGLAIFVALVILSFRACSFARKVSTSGGPPILAKYALGLELGLVAFVVGGTFVMFQYTEIIWHFFGLSTALYALAQQHVAEAVPKEAAAPSTFFVPRLANASGSR